MSFRTTGNCIKLDRNNKQHLVFFTPGFPKDESDTTCITALQIFVKAFSQKFEGKVSVITFQYPFFTGSYQWHGINIYALGGSNQNFRKLFVRNRAKKCFKLLNVDWPVTHLHSFWLGECAWLASIIARQYSLPHSCTLMGQDVLPGNRYIKRIRSPIRLITLSDFHARQLQINYHVLSEIIPWGVSSLNIEAGEKSIDMIAVGSLIPLKCFDEFFMIISQIREIYPNITCKIVGDGPLFKLLSKRINTEGLTQNVELLGARPYEETQQLIAGSRFLVHLSEFESFGMVIIEALQLQTRVISKPVGIAAEIADVIKVDSIVEAVGYLEKTLLQRDVPRPIIYPVEQTVKEYQKVFAETRL